APPLNANGTQAMQGTDDAVIVRGSLDCGLSWFDIYAMDASNTGSVTNAMVPRTVDLTAYAGQELIIGFYARRTNTALQGSYDFHLDNVVIQTGDVCTGMRVAGTASSSNAGPSCAPASTILSVSGQSTDGGIVITWYSSDDAAGPF